MRRTAHKSGGTYTEIQPLAGEVLPGIYLFVYYFGINNEPISQFIYFFMLCLQDLLGDLHKELLAEYVRKMMKNKIRFADKEKQEKAAEAVCKNSDSIHTRLTTAVSAHYSNTRTPIPS